MLNSTNNFFLNEQTNKQINKPTNKTKTTSKKTTTQKTLLTSQPNKNNFKNHSYAALSLSIISNTLSGWMDAGKT